MERITVRINDEPIEVPLAAPLTDALAKYGLEDARGIAVAVNERVVPKKDWENRALSDRDSILVIKASQGG